MIISMTLASLIADDMVIGAICGRTKASKVASRLLNVPYPL